MVSMLSTLEDDKKLSILKVYEDLEKTRSYSMSYDQFFLHLQVEIVDMFKSNVIFMHYSRLYLCPTSLKNWERKLYIYL